MKNKKKKASPNNFEKVAPNNLLNNDIVSLLKEQAHREQMDEKMSKVMLKLARLDGFEALSQKLEQIAKQITSLEMTNQSLISKEQSPNDSLTEKLTEKFDPIFERMDQKFKQLDQLEQLDALNNLTLLKKLDDLQDLNKLEFLNQLDSLQKLDNLELLDKLSRMNELTKLDKLDSLQLLGEETVVKNLERLEKLEGLSFFKDKMNVYLVKSILNTGLDFFKVVVVAVFLVFLYNNVISQDTLSKAAGSLSLVDGSRVNFALSMLSGNIERQDFQNICEKTKKRLEYDFDLINLGRGDQIFSHYNVMLYKSFLAINYKNEFVDFERYTRDLKSEKVEFYTKSVTEQIKYYKTKNILDKNSLERIDEIIQDFSSGNYQQAIKKYLTIEKIDRYNIYSYLGRMIFLEAGYKDISLIENLELGYE